MGRPKWMPDTYKDCEERTNEIIKREMYATGKRQEDLANALNVSRSSVGNKLNLKHDSTWTLRELYGAFDYLKVSNEDILKIFGRKVSKT